MGTFRIRYDGLFAAGLALFLLSWSSPVRAGPVDLTQQDFTSTLAQIEKADGWYDETNYGAAAAGLRGKKYFLPDGIDMGSYLLFLEVGAGTTYDDNIYATRQNRKGDFRSVGTASLAAISRLPRHLFNVYLDGSYVNYADDPDADYFDGAARADWRIDIDHGHALGGRFASTYEHEDRLAPEAPLEAREAVPVLANEAEIAFTRDQGRLGATFGLDFADHDYSDVEAFDGSRIDQDFRDMTSYGAYLGLNYRFSPGYKLLTTVRAGRELYHDADAELRDATVYEGKVGLAFELSPLSAGASSITSAILEGAVWGLFFSLLCRGVMQAATLAALAAAANHLFTETGAINYVDQAFLDKATGAEVARLIFVRPGQPSPHDLRLQAEQERDAAYAERDAAIARP